MCLERGRSLGRIMSSRIRHLSLLALMLSVVVSHALTDGPYTYTVSADGQATITAFSLSYSGHLDITNSLGGYLFPILAKEPSMAAQDLAALRSQTRYPCQIWKTFLKTW